METMPAVKGIKRTMTRKLGRQRLCPGLRAELSTYILSAPNREGDLLTGRPGQSPEPFKRRRSGLDGKHSPLPSLLELHGPTGQLLATCGCSTLLFN